MAAGEGERGGKEVIIRLVCGGLHIGGGVDQRGSKTMNPERYGDCMEPGYMIYEGRVQRNEKRGATYSGRIHSHSLAKNWDMYSWPTGSKNLATSQGLQVLRLTNSTSSTSGILAFVFQGGERHSGQNVSRDSRAKEVRTIIVSYV